MTETRSIKWLTEAPEKTNLATDLTEQELNTLAQDVIRTYDLDRMNRHEWDTQSERALKLAKQVLEKKSTPWPNSANVKHPLITVATIQFAARAYPEICKGSRVVKCQITGDDIPKPPAQLPAHGQVPNADQAGSSPPSLSVANPPTQPVNALQAPGTPTAAGAQGAPSGPSPGGNMPAPAQPMQERPKQLRASRIACFSYDTEVLTALGWMPIWNSFRDSARMSTCRPVIIWKP